MATFNFKIDPKGLRAFQKRALRTATNISKHAVDAVTSALEGAVEESKRLVDGGGRLSTRSTNLRESIGFEVSGGKRGSTITASYGLINPKEDVILYGAAHEYGAHIEPVDAEVLAIPLDNALDSDGIKLLEPHEVTDVYGASFWQNDILFGRDGEEITPLFYAADEVDIPEQRYLRDPLNEAAEVLGDDFVKKVIRDMIRV